MARLTAIIGTIMALVLVSTASAAPPKTVTVDYDGGHGIRFEHNLTVAVLGDDIVTPRATAPANARTVGVRVIDDSGMGTDVHLHIDKDGDGKDERYYDFCNETATPIPVKPKWVVEVFLFSGSCETAPSMVTTGTVEFTFGT